VLCDVRTFFGLFSNQFRSPISGTIEFFTEANAHIGIRGKPRPVTVDAYISGIVIEVDTGRSVTISTNCAFAQGIFGVGGERHGEVFSLDCPNDSIVLPGALQSVELKNKVIIGGASFSAESLDLCASAGVSAVITGSIDSFTLEKFAGRDISVSVTGDEDVPFTLIITEGFGLLPLSTRIADLMRSLNGITCSVNGATQVRAGATRPEIIVPLETRPDGFPIQPNLVLSVGSRIRLIRVPYFGRFAIVREMPSEPEEIPSGAVVRVLRAELDSGEVITVPRSNVKLV